MATSIMFQSVHGHARINEKFVMVNGKFATKQLANEIRNEYQLSLYENNDNDKSECLSLSIKKAAVVLKTTVERVKRLADEEMLSYSNQNKTRITFNSFCAEYKRKFDTEYKPEKNQVTYSYSTYKCGGYIIYKDNVPIEYTSYNPDKSIDRLSAQFIKKNGGTIQKQENKVIVRY